MRKSIYILLSIFLLTACSRSLYYVYDEDGTREGYPAGYCAFEVKGNKQDIIYRGYSEIYADPDITPYAPKYIYMQGNSKNLIDNEWSIVLDVQKMYIQYIYVQDFPDVVSNKDNSISIITPAMELNIFEANASIIYSISEKKDSSFISQNRGLKFGSYGSINWFPPYVKKVNKIDYEQFKRSGDLGINYKEPLKSKKKK